MVKFSFDWVTFKPNCQQNVPNLQEAISTCRENYNAGALVTVKGYTNGIIFSRGTFFLFDSHARNDEGKIEESGAAVVIAFATSEALAIHLVDVYFPKGTTRDEQCDIIGLSTEEGRLKSPTGVPETMSSRIAYYAKLHKALSKKMTWKGKWKKFVKAVEAVNRSLAEYELPSRIANLQHITIDSHAANHLPKEMTNVEPVVNSGGGSCFYKAVSQSLFGMEDCHIELRLRTVCELTLQYEKYCKEGFWQEMFPGQTSNKLFEYVGTNSIGREEFLRGKTVKEAIQFNIMKSIDIQTFSGLLHLTALATVCNCKLHQIYPEVTHSALNRDLHTHAIEPRKVGIESSIGVTILWTSKSHEPVNSFWIPDHFVLCREKVQPPKSAQGNKREKRKETGTPKRSDTKSARRKLEVDFTRQQILEALNLLSAEAVDFKSVKEGAQFVSDTIGVFHIFKEQKTGHQLKYHQIDMENFAKPPEAMSNCVVLAVTGDCHTLFKSVSILLTGTEAYAQELQIQVLLDLCLNMQKYVDSREMQNKVETEALLLQGSCTKFSDHSGNTDTTRWRSMLEKAALNLAADKDEDGYIYMEALASTLNIPIYIWKADSSNRNCDSHIRRTVFPHVAKSLESTQKSSNLQSKEEGRKGMNEMNLFMYSPDSNRNKRSTHYAPIRVAFEAEAAPMKQESKNREEDDTKKKAKNPTLELLDKFRENGSVWTEDLTETVFSRPYEHILYALHKLREKAGKVYGSIEHSGLFMETPVTCLCPLIGCESRIILSHVNDVHNLRRHLIMAHRECKVARSLWRRWDAMNDSKLDVMEGIEVDITKIRNPAELKPVIPEDGKHYLVKWLEKFLQRGELKSTDLFYEEIDAQFTVHLCSSEQIRWEKFPTLNEYCSALRNTVDQKAYNLFLGKHNVGSKNERPSFSNVNHPGPNVRALYRKKGTPNYDGGIAYDVVAAFTLLLENCKESVFYKDEKQKFKWYPCVVGYDEQPLNKGTFIRALENDLYIDGIKPSMSFTEIMQLKEEGIDIVNHIQKYISEVKEFFVTDVGGNVSLNFATFFSVGAYDANVVVAELNSVIGQMSRCLNCITSGSECHNENGCCLLCASGNKECVYLRAIHCYADMLPAQRMAHELLNGQQALTPFSRMTGQYTLFTFGFLHVCKALVGYIRNWYITDNKDCFNIAMICGLLSNAKFDMMSSQIDPRMLNYRDRHSDVVAYNTVGPQVQALLKSAKSVTVTLVPDLYRPWTLESKSHKELLKQPQPCYVAVNARGEVFWSDRINHTICMGNRHNPMKIQVFGSYGVQSKAKDGVLAQKALFSGPGGVAVGVDGKNEVLIVADTGNNCLKLITGCRSFRTKKVVYTLTGTVGPFVPLALHFVESKNLLMVSNIATGHITIGKVNWSQHIFSAVKNVGGMSGATGLCFHIGLGAMLVAKGKELIIYDMENENLQSQRWTDSTVECVGDVAVDSTGRVAVSDSEKNVVHILQEANTGKRLQFCESLGSGSCNGQDGHTQFASFEEPIGLCFYGRSMYICCHRSGLKLTSPTDFAVAYCEKVRNLYICAGYRPRGEDISSKDYQQSIQEIARCSTFFSNVNELRKSNLQSENVSTQDGALYQQTVNCLKTSACMLNTQLNTFAIQTNWFMNKGLCVRAFTNEAVVEHGFGFSQQQSQYTALSMEQYARNKVDNCSTNIWKLCRNNFSYHLSENKQYQAPHSLSVKATDIFDIMKKVRKQLVDVDKDYKEPVKSDKLDKLKVINRILKPQACQNTRAKYKAHCGSAPCTTTIVDRREIRGPSFSGKNKISLKKETVLSEEEGDNGIVAGDILAVLGEQENDKNEWWLLQANRSLPTSKWKRNCEVTGYWLEQQDIDICQEDSVTYCLDDRNEVKVRYRNLIKGKDGDPYLVPQECFCSGWKDSQTLFSFSKQLCDELDSLLELALILEVDSEDNIEPESITEEANNYCQDLGTSSRQRSISSKGRMYKSYKDMLSTH